MAAVLACGDGAVLSHGSAAALWGLLRPIKGPIDVSVPSGNGRGSRRGIRLHRCPSLALPAREDGGGREETLVTVHNDIPVTTVHRTVDDLRSTVPSHLLRRATRQAELAGYRVRGVEAKRTRSDLEDDFLHFCRRHRLPRPEVNVKVGRFEIDFVWRAQRVAVETDDFRYHRGSVAYEDDHARDLELRRHGFAVRRFTGQQLDEEPDLVAADLREALLIELAA
jgi:very-short-patch-repair endonuclease